MTFDIYRALYKDGSTRTRLIERDELMALTPVNSSNATTSIVWIV